MGLSAVALLGLAAEPESPSAEACGRLALWLRPHQAKQLGRWFDASPRTAEGWRKGQWPYSRHEHRMVQRWGKAFLDFVYAPLLPSEDRALGAQLAELEGRLAAVRITIEEAEARDAEMAAAARPLAAPGGAAARAAADGGSGTAGGAGGRLGSLGARAGALALALSIVAATLLAPDLAQARTLRARPGGVSARVVRVVRHGEVG